MRTRKFYIERIAAWLAALILVQTLYYKFSGHPESVYIFTKMGIEPYGRVGLGIVELITALLLVVPKTTIYGAVLGMCIMVGAFISHLFILGIVVNNDGGTLFLLALITFLCCAIVAFMNREKLMQLLKRN